MGDTYSTYGQILPGSSNTNIVGIQRVDRPRVEESEITGLEQNGLYIKKERRSEIIKAHCIYGNARATYAEPMRRTTRTPSSSRFSWLVFILLLIFPPAAFIYSLIVCGRTGKIISAIILVLMLAAIVTQIILMTTYGS